MTMTSAMNRTLPYAATMIGNLSVTLSENVNKTDLHFPEKLTTGQVVTLLLWPVVTLAAIIVFLRLWEPKDNKPKFKLPASVNTYGSIPTSATDFSLGLDRRDSDNVSDGSDTLHPGDVAGAYLEDWKRTFDFVFVWIMLAFFIILIIFTVVLKPELFWNAEFWFSQAPKVVAMMTVSFVGGLICRHFCVIDEDGYVMTTTHSAFKVNYTRKLQHFAAYLIPLVFKPGPACNCSGSLELAWGDFFTLSCFLLLIKPIRERFTFFMLQFNSLDRPEDRPNTLKWIIAGNILPGLGLILFFRTLFAESRQEDLVFIMVCITGIGDGLAEPIGVTFGRHKYRVKSWFSPRAYTRSLEGSACVFMSGLIFPAIMYKSFRDPTQLWFAMLILPPAMAYAEATAPHTMDTPALMIISGVILYLIELAL